MPCKNDAKKRTKKMLYNCCNTVMKFQKQRMQIRN